MDSPSRTPPFRKIVSPPAAKHIHRPKTPSGCRVSRCAVDRLPSRQTGARGQCPSSNEAGPARGSRSARATWAAAGPERCPGEGQGGSAPRRAAPGFNPRGGQPPARCRTIAGVERPRSSIVRSPCESEEGSPWQADPSIPRDGSAITVEWIQSALAAGGHPLAQHLEGVRTEEIGVGAGVLGQVVRCHLGWKNGPRRRERGAAGFGGKVSAPCPRPSSSSCRARPPRTGECRNVSPSTAASATSTGCSGHGFPLRTSKLFLRPLRTAESPIRPDAGGSGGPWESSTRSRVPPPPRPGGRSELWHACTVRSGTEPTSRPLAAVYDATNPKFRPVVQTVYLANLVRTLGHFGAAFSSTTRQLAQAFGMSVIDHMATLAACPQTFTHGDYRLDNLFLRRRWQRRRGQSSTGKSAARTVASTTSPTFSSAT